MSGSSTGSWRRGFWATVFRHLRNRWNNETNEKFAGRDYMGNQYFESLKTDPSGKTKPKRWYFPTKGDDWDKAIPPEWEAWLRYRRDARPTEEEIAQNIAMATVKKQRASELAAKEALERGELPQTSATEDEAAGRPTIPPPADSKFTRFPKYEDYEKLRRGMADRKKDPYYDDHK